MDRNLALEAVRITEWAALASSKWMGRGDETAADRAAVTAMRDALNTLDIDGTVVIGEGQRDNAPQLYCGEKVGTGNGRKIDIALDPLEGTTITAVGGNNAMTVLAMTTAGGFLQSPDVYMQKIAVGGGLPDNVVQLHLPIAQNLQNLADAKGVYLDELTVCILKRDRHGDLIAKVRAAGCRIMLIDDGDVAAVIAAAMPDSGIDMYVGTGGAPEGVLAAAALACIGGQIQGKLLFEEELHKQQARDVGITDFNKIYTLNDLASGDDIMFAATGVTDGTLLDGVRRSRNGISTQSIVMRASTGTVRMLDTQHNFQRKPFKA